MRNPGEQLESASISRLPDRLKLMMLIKLLAKCLESNKCCSKTSPSFLLCIIKTKHCARYRINSQQVCVLFTLCPFLGKKRKRKRVQGLLYEKQFYSLTGLQFYGKMTKENDVQTFKLHMPRMRGIETILLQRKTSEPEGDSLYACSLGMPYVKAFGVYLD